MTRATILIAIAIVLVLSAVPAARAQKGPELRAVHGTVMSKSDDPIPGAVVYLKNVKSLAVRTYISESMGQYQFSGLDPNVDYELHAENGDQTSGNHTISSFDSRKDIVVSLKIDKQKKKSTK